jgi:hypothetical protein
LGFLSFSLRPNAQPNKYDTKTVIACKCIFAFFYSGKRAESVKTP